MTIKVELLKEMEIELCIVSRVTSNEDSWRASLKNKVRLPTSISNSNLNNSGRDSSGIKNVALRAFPLVMA